MFQILQTAALTQKNSKATQALAVREEILEKELGEIQKVLLAMQVYMKQNGILNSMAKITCFSLMTYISPDLISRLVDSLSYMCVV